MRPFSHTSQSSTRVGSSFRLSTLQRKTMRWSMRTKSHQCRINLNSQQDPTSCTYCSRGLIRIALSVWSPSTITTQGPFSHTLRPTTPLNGSFMACVIFSSLAICPLMWKRPQPMCRCENQRWNKRTTQSDWVRFKSSKRKTSSAAR